MAGTVLHLRTETKPLEHRSALTPTTCKALIDAGYEVHVERNSKDKPERVFDDGEFEAVGAKLVATHSWRDASSDHIIIGLKELAEERFALKHVHVQFAHCYKQQSGWETVLARFRRGGGTLLDLEYLTDDKGRRVAAFGFHAGFAGAALALEVWAWQQTHSEPFPAVSSYPNEDALMQDVKKALQKGAAKAGRMPHVVVIGALGRCGGGTVSALRKAGVPQDQILKWDMAETAKGGPFPEISDSDILVNCIYLTSKIPPFVNIKALKEAGDKRALQVVCDVSADSTNPNNPVPIYTFATTFDAPTVSVEGLDKPSLSVISIDHLPSLLPREASEAFSQDLLPHLLRLQDWQNAPVWQRAEQLFKEKVSTLPAAALDK